MGFDRRKADRAEQFFPAYLTHAKGELLGQPFILDPAKKKVTRQIFGTVNADGMRQYRTVYITMGRKNGKTLWGAGLALLSLYLDGEPGAEIYACAASKDQAAIVFEIAKTLIRANEILSSQVEILKDVIYHPRTDSTFTVLSSDADTKHGLNPSVVIVDELHTHRNRELYDVMETGTAGRRQPLMVILTTAGHDKRSFCYEIHQRAVAIQKRKKRDRTFLPVIYSAPANRDWRKPATWKLANPCYGYAVKHDYLEAKAKDAEESPTLKNRFERLHCNRWTDVLTSWLPARHWNACAGLAEGESPMQWRRRMLKKFKGADCWVALDLSNTADLTVAVPTFRDEDRFVQIPFVWIPGEYAEERSKRDRVPYVDWLGHGWIEPMPGEIIDQRVIRRWFADFLAPNHKIREVAFDPWNASQFAQELKEESGLELVEFRQTYAKISEPTKGYESAVRSQRLVHGGNPVLTWCVENVVIDQDSSGNQKPSKDKSAEKIDAAVAGIMSLSRARSEQKPKASVYATGQHFTYSS